MMGDGLKRVAKLCGGLTVTARGETVRYDGEGKAMPDNKPFADGILRHTTGRPAETVHSTYLREVARCRPSLPDPTPEQRVRGRWPGAWAEPFDCVPGWVLIIAPIEGKDRNGMLGSGLGQEAAWADAAGRLGG